MADFFASEGPLVGSSSFCRDLNSLICLSGRQTAPVLIQGERGTGKAFVASKIHLETSKSHDGLFVLDCAVLSDKELHDAFLEATDALAFEGGRRTVLVRRVERLSLAIQQEILLLLRAGGGSGAGWRLICTSEADIGELVEGHSFLEDLYFQISSIPIKLLPLRQRTGDIFPLAQYFFDLYRMRSDTSFTGFADGTRPLLERLFWRGNVLELRNAVERGFIVGEPPFIQPSDMGLVSSASLAVADEALSPDGADKSLKAAVDQFKKKYVTKILEENGWNQTRTAAVLGIQRTYVIRLIKELNISKI